MGCREQAAAVLCPLYHRRRRGGHLRSRHAATTTHIHTPHNHNNNTTNTTPKTHNKQQTSPLLRALNDALHSNGQGNPEFANLPRKLNICVSPSRDDFPHTQVGALCVWVELYLDGAVLGRGCTWKGLYLEGGVFGRGCSGACV